MYIKDIKDINNVTGLTNENLEKIIGELRKQNQSNQVLVDLVQDKKTIITKEGKFKRVPTEQKKEKIEKPEKPEVKTAREKRTEEREKLEEKAEDRLLFESPLKQFLRDRSSFADKFFNWKQDRVENKTSGSYGSAIKQLAIGGISKIPGLDIVGDYFSFAKKVQKRQQRRREDITDQEIDDANEKKAIAEAKAEEKRLKDEEIQLELAEAAKEKREKVLELIHQLVFQEGKTVESVKDALVRAGLSAKEIKSLFEEFGQQVRDLSQVQIQKGVKLNKEIPAVAEDLKQNEYYTEPSVITKEQQEKIYAAQGLTTPEERANWDAQQKLGEKRAWRIAQNNPGGVKEFLEKKYNKEAPPIWETRGLQRPFDEDNYDDEELFTPVSKRPQRLAVEHKVEPKVAEPEVVGVSKKTEELSTKEEIKTRKNLEKQNYPPELIEVALKKLKESAAAGAGHVIVESILKPVKVQNVSPKTGLPKTDTEKKEEAPILSGPVIEAKNKPAVMEQPSVQPSLPETGLKPLQTAIKGATDSFKEGVASSVKTATLPLVEGIGKLTPAVGELGAVLLPVLGAILAVAGGLTIGTIIGNKIKDKVDTKLKEKGLDGGSVYDKTHKDPNKTLSKYQKEIAKKRGIDAQTPEELDAAIKAQRAADGEVKVKPIEKPKVKETIESLEKDKTKKLKDQKEAEQEARKKEHDDLIQGLKDKRAQQVLPGVINGGKKMDYIRTFDDLSSVSRGSIR